MSIEKFQQKASEAISKLKKLREEEVTVIFHDDADGLCSGAITYKFLEREGFKVKRFCLEKLYPEVIENLHKKENRVIFYCDIGSSHANLISNLNKNKNLVIILDHHDFVESDDPNVFDLNLERFSLKGETDFSSSTVCYLFAKLMNHMNMDLSYLALIGSCEIPGDFIKINREIMEEAIKNKILRVDGKKLIINKFNLDIKEVFSMLQVLGPVGYYKNGPELGIKLCFDGLDDEIKERFKELEESRKVANKKLLNKIMREGLNQTKHLQWFDAGDIYKDMGTKVIGTFCSYLSYQRRFIKPFKYILGFTNMRDDIPGYGKLKNHYVKVSMRAPSMLQEYINKNKSPSTVELLKKTCEKIDGIADGHAVAASAAILANKKEALIDEIESFFATK
ncbi:MAG: DHH family phosphoesterase [Candidatus Parvarchaeota archaeon]|nr:DHH family phosphoesterase [Candidatus Jingweiarchaeum tengchongense]MCW1298449.1 DHH family phosphoesterase [Candidatus Jingweiarchaeum tengchongense]MCW1300541.1 DHH family phosphoesterase [Candidatus Jingweiarchaeum tengchongense]MCW1304984.1 DHH family phosphoesterase [Candidatus Jingweiarchaeum tengchongense]MCW1309758.1 DHH family phosphoesterase [Candidatus Jingweiarchaeum tengchongense]